jgi:hypothetical protein
MNTSNKILLKVLTKEKYREAITRTKAFRDEDPDSRFLELLMEAHEEKLNHSLIVIAYGRYESELRRGGKTAPARAALIATPHKDEV